MALKEPFMVKQVIGADLELEADPEEAFRILDIQAEAAGTLAYATLTIAKTTVGHFIVCGANYTHLPFAQIFANIYTPLGWLREKGIFSNYPVASGEKIKLSMQGADASKIARFVYQIWDPADVRNTDDNGSAAKKYFFINYGHYSRTISDGTYETLDVALSPAEFPDFPFGKTVPANTTITIHGVMVLDVANLEYLRIVRARETLWDEDKNGIYVEHDHNLFREVKGGTWVPYLLPEPLVFEAGEEVLFQLSADGGDILTDSSIVGLLETVERRA